MYTCLDQQFSHFAKVKDSVQSFKPYFDSADLIAFAVKVLQVLNVERKCFILDGLVRVDLFMNDDNDLVVNELESLDANYLCASSTRECETSHFLACYWESKIYNGICDVLA